MPLHHSIAFESAAARRFRRSAPLLVVAVLSAVALAPGLIAGDRPFQRSLCEGHETLGPCASPASTIAAEAGRIR